MTEPYLILHKVRGQPAFDIAIKVNVGAEDETKPGWIGEWWIIPTSGHRAYPYKWWSLEGLGQGSDCGFPLFSYTEVPASLPDHYACNETPKPKPPARMLSTDDFLV